MAKNLQDRMQTIRNMTDVQRIAMLRQLAAQHPEIFDQLAREVSAS